MLTDAQVQLLAEYIKAEIKEDFAEKHLSGNLMNTIFVSKTPDGFQVEIPAEIYNMYQFQMHGVVIHTGKGSYANQLDTTGSEFFSYKKGGGRVWVTPHNHKNYIETSIRRAITKWLTATGLKGDTKYL